MWEKEGRWEIKGEGVREVKGIWVVRGKERIGEEGKYKGEKKRKKVKKD